MSSCRAGPGRKAIASWTAIPSCWKRWCGATADRREAVQAALTGSDADVLLVSGGSSVGQEDHAPRVLAEVGELAVHGVALRPASPTGLGFLGGRPVFLLPGNPVSC